MHDQKAIMTYSMQDIGEYKESDQGSALKARDYKDATDLDVDCRNKFDVAVSFDRAAYNQGENAKYNPTYTENQVQTLVAKGPGGVAYNKPQQGYIVRRLTPLECCRLQGFPDGWAELKPYSDDDYQFWNSIHPGTPAQVQRWYNKLHTDSAEYKMWGNGIALPCALYVFEGIEEEIRLAHESPDVAND